MLELLKKLKILLLTAKNDKIKLSKSLAIGAIFSIFIGYSTSELTYSFLQNGQNLIIGAEQYNYLHTDNDDDDKWSKKREFKSTIIIMSFIFGASLSYSLIKENDF